MIAQHSAAEEKKYLSGFFLDERRGILLFVIFCEEKKKYK
jgi:hypothetical protein